MVKDRPVPLNDWVASRLGLGILEKGNISYHYLVLNLDSLVITSEVGYAVLTSCLCIKRFFYVMQEHEVVLYLRMNKTANKITKRVCGKFVALYCVMS